MDALGWGVSVAEEGRESCADEVEIGEVVDHGREGIEAGGPARADRCDADAFGVEHDEIASVLADGEGEDIVPLGLFDQEGRCVEDRLSQLGVESCGDLLVRNGPLNWQDNVSPLEPTLRWVHEATVGFPSMKMGSGAFYRLGWVSAIDERRSRRRSAGFVGLRIRGSSAYAENYVDIEVLTAAASLVTH